MPVMKRLTVDGVNYDTVGEASVTQVQTSGTKIATVTIDGTATDLYAPEGGGGGPEPSSTTPAMDGTAAVGTATTYARADHVHPTDTSRQATLVSGTNIKTINGASILGSGDIAISGGADFKLVPVFITKVTNYRATVTIPDVGPDDMVTVFSSFGSVPGFPNYGNMRPYVEKNVNGVVTFKLASAGGDITTSYPVGVLVAVFSNYELEVFGLTSSTVSNRKPEAGETVTVSGSPGSFGTYNMFYNDLVTGESVNYATVSDTSTYSGSFTMPPHPVYLTVTYSGGGNN